MAQGKLFIASAISGAGKTTLIRESLRRLQENGYAIDRLITYTTRAPRINEIQNVDYNFLSHEEFIEKQKNNFFFEVASFNDHLYGTSAEFVRQLELGKSFIVPLNKEGTHEMRERLPNNTITILITAPSLEIARERMIKRGGMTQAQIEKRIEISRKELEVEEKSHRLYTYHLINDVFDQSVQELCKIIIDELT